MRRRMMKSKIHRATVTSADLHYVGSISLCPDLMERADIKEWEQVAVLDIDNGARFETYAIVATERRFTLDYAEVVDAADLSVPPVLAGELRLLIAAKLGKARLIDNIGAVR